MRSLASGMTLRWRERGREGPRAAELAAASTAARHAGAGRAAGLLVFKICRPVALSRAIKSRGARTVL